MWDTAERTGGAMVGRRWLAVPIAAVPAGGLLAGTMSRTVVTGVAVMAPTDWHAMVRDCVEHGTVQPKELRIGTPDDWFEARKLLRIRLPSWTFGGDRWQPPAFSD